jgi:hypothetical protein
MRHGERLVAFTGAHTKLRGVIERPVRVLVKRRVNYFFNVPGYT